MTMSSPLLTYQGAVYPWHCDHVGHMNVMWYVSKFDEATWVLFAALGLTAAYLRDQRRGMAAVQQNITYKRELLAGDTVAVTSRILEVRNKVLRFEHVMCNTQTEEIAAVCDLTGVHLDRDSRRACPLPDAVRAKAAALAG